MRNYTVKENNIGSAVSKILWYRQTDRHHVTILKELFTTLKVYIGLLIFEIQIQKQTKKSKNENIHKKRSSKIMDGYSEKMNYREIS